MMSKAGELRDRSEQELKSDLERASKDYFSLRMQKAMQTLNKFHKIRQVRRQIARIKTIISQKEKGMV